MSKTTALSIARLIVALTMIAKGALMLVKTASAESGSYGSAMASSLFGFALAITGVVLAAPELVMWAASPIWRFITGIVFPDDQFDRPPVNYALPRSYRGRLRSEDAIAEYLKITHYHPQQLTAYKECLEVMFEVGDLQAARKLRARGLRKLRSSEARRRLSQHYDSLIRKPEPAVQ
jgi:hypothetical protein